MRRILIIAAVVITLCDFSFAEELISKVRFTGVKPVSGLNLYSRAKRVFVSDSLGSDSLKIVKAYQERGWFDCEVTIQNYKRTNGVELEFVLDKKELYNLYIEMKGMMSGDSLMGPVEYLLEVYNKQPALVDNLSGLADDLIDLYSQNGYPYCEVRFDDFQVIRPDSLKLILDIQPGPLVTVERIEFEGIKNIDPGFLSQYLGLYTPFYYSTERFESAQKRLAKTDFIEEADQYQLRYLDRPERGVIILPIKEVSPLTLDGAAGYSSKDDEFYGKFNATIANILGKGRLLQLEWSKKDKHSRWLDLSFSEPYPLGIPFEMVLDVYQEDRDSTYIENGGSLGLNYLGSTIYSYGVAVGASRLDPESYGRTLMPYKDNLWLSVSFSADNRDYPQNPRTGEYLYLQADFVTETTRADSLFAASNTSYRTAELKAEKYLPLTGLSTILVGVYAAGDFTENVTVDRLIALGGSGSLRGYMQDQFYVSRQAVGTIEYRLLTSKRGRAYIFSDGAVYQIPKQSGDGSDTYYKAGLGIGLAASVRLGTATIEMAVPSDGGFGSTKLHFGLKTSL